MTDDPARMHFSEIVGLLNEPNMCSGGYSTIHDLLRAAPWLARPGLRWLEVGSNTGFACCELASLLDGPITGVDLDSRSNAHARNKAAELQLENVTFLDGDGTNLDFPDDEFDVLFCSNVTSFISDREQAVREYFRVVRPLGFVVAVPIYYFKPPPASVLNAVETAIGTRLEVVGLDGWKDLFSRAGGTLLHETGYRYRPQQPERIEQYARQVEAQATNRNLDARLRSAAGARLLEMFQLFDQNLESAGFSTLIFRKGMPTNWPVLHESCAT